MRELFTKMIPVMLIWTFLCSVIDAEGCAPDLCRVVRKQITEVNLQTLLSASPHCPLSAARDVYLQLEENKLEESSKWGCLVCGKQFYEERFLDKHLLHRHPELVIKDSEAVCLADYCDMFRCDVFQRRSRDDYWDVALCREEQLRAVKQRCLNVLEQCTADRLDNQSQTLLCAGFNSICNHLTCDKYWDVLNTDLDHFYTFAYVFASIVLGFALLIYYYVAYTHFYTDDSLLQEFHFESKPQNRYLRTHLAARHRLKDIRHNA